MSVLTSVGVEVVYVLVEVAIDYGVLQNFSCGGCRYYRGYWKGDLSGETCRGLGGNGRDRAGRSGWNCRATVELDRKLREKITHLDCKYKGTCCRQQTTLLL